MNKAFIFDMDGVIVDSNPYHKIALQQFCKKLGYDLSEEQLREKIYGRTNKDWITNLFGDIGEAQIQRYAEEKEALYRQLYDKQYRFEKDRFINPGEDFTPEPAVAAMPGAPART